MSLKLADLAIFALGFTAQFMFFARTIVQWFRSEKAGKVLSPVLYWKISLLAAILMLVYGLLRKDFAIILGQLITFFIYVRNLHLKGSWQKMPMYFKVLALSLPFVCLIWSFTFGNISLNALIANEDIAHWLLIFGTSAQIIFTFRFIYQWLMSEKSKHSHLPLGFWYFSLTGGLMTLVYAIFRRDPVLLMGNMGGVVMYSRNLILHYTGKGIFDILPFDLEAIRNKFNRK